MWNGRALHGRKIGVQQSKVSDRNSSISRHNFAARGKRTAYNKGGQNAFPFSKHSSKGVMPINSEDQVWIVNEGDTQVVKIAESLVSSLKQEVYHSFVATVNRLDVDERDLQEWFYNEKSLQVEVRRLHFPMFWLELLQMTTLAWLMSAFL